MSGPKSTRWGSFLQQAVAGVEARLDNILAENDEANPHSKLSAAPNTSNATSPSKSSTGATKSPGAARANDRLKERLARAVAAKASANQGTSKAESMASISISDSASAISAEASPRPSSDSLARPVADSARTSSDEARGTTSAASEQASATRAAAATENTVSQTDRVSTMDEALAEPSLQNPNERNSEELKPGDSYGEDRDSSLENGTDRSVPEREDTAENMRTRDLEEALEQAKLSHQEELHIHIERIDALEAKLQYLSREASESARKAVLAAPSGSVDRKLAENDQKISELMMEGQTLARNELQHRTLIKKLRTKIAEDEKMSADSKTKNISLEGEVEDLKKRLRKAEEWERSYHEVQKKVVQLQKDVDSLRADAISKDATISSLSSQLHAASDKAEKMSAALHEETLDQSMQRVKELEDSMAALEVEKSLVADRAKLQANDLRDKANRAAERARMLELEMRSEMQILESKLEAMRARAEEASSGVTGDAQAKLLRQIETLQSQYTSASENWQGIEGTLVSRIAMLEKEKDEALARELEMRRRAREAAARARRHEDELEEARNKFPGFQKDLASYQGQVDSLQKRASEAEAALSSARADLEKQLSSAAAASAALKEDKPDLAGGTAPSAAALLDRERRSWLDDLPSAQLASFRSHNSGSRPESPLLLSAASQRTPSLDVFGLQVPPQPNARNKTSVHSSASDTPPVDREAASAAAAGAMPSLRHPSSQKLARGRPPMAVSTGQASATGGLGIESLFSPGSITTTTTTTTTAEASAAAVLPAEADALTTPPPLPETPRDELLFEDTMASSSSSAAHHQDMMMQDVVSSASTVAAGPSVQLVERMSAAIRRLESEKMASREELARVAAQRNEARDEIVSLMRDVDESRRRSSRVPDLERDMADLNARYQTTLEMLGEKSEEVDELRADVEDVKAMYRDLVERTVK